MKKTMFTLLSLALISVPLSAGSVGLFASSYAPDDTDNSVGFGGKMEFGSGNKEFLLRAALYDELTSDADPVEFEIQATTVDLGMNYNFSGGERVQPYVGGGVTYAVFDFNVDAAVAGSETLGRGVDIDPEIGWYGQIGVEWLLGSNTSIFLEALFRQMDAEVEGDDLGAFLDQDVSMSGAAVNLGLSWGW